MALTVTPSVATAGGTTAKEISLLDMVNASRASRGIGALGLSDRLSKMARRHSRQMAGERRLFHHSCLSCRFASGWKLLGENVGTAPTLRKVHRMMMKSAAHRKILLTPGFDSVGIGVVKRGGTFWVTEIFFA